MSTDDIPPLNKFTVSMVIISVIVILFGTVGVAYSFVSNLEPRADEFGRYVER